MNVWIVDMHPEYLVMCDGEIIDRMTSRPGWPPLTWSQQLEIAAGYREAMSW